MFGLTFEKLLILGVIAAFILGPERLPHYAGVFAKFIRNVRDYANNAKSRMKEEMGPDFDDVDWRKLDPRQYDPRRIIREALLEDPAKPVRSGGPTLQAPALGVTALADAEEKDTSEHQERSSDADETRPALVRFDNEAT